MVIARSHRVYGLIIALALISLVLTGNGAVPGSNTSGDGISPEKKVAYMNRPCVVEIKCLHWGTLANKNGEAKIYLNLDGTGKTEVDLPFSGIGGTGSGFIISQDGYILTNAHVVYKSDEDLKDDLVRSIGNYLLAKYPQIAGENDEHRDELFSTLRSDYTTKKREADTELKVFFGGQISTASNDGIPAEIRTESPKKFYREEGSTYRYATGKDLAIIKIEGFDNLPTVTLGDSDSADVGDKVIIIGYPYLVMSDALGMSILSPMTDLVPTVTSGIISAWRKQPDSSDVIQIDAAIQHGNSGGPAFNEKGEVIGVATWGSYMKLAGLDGYSESEIYNFIIPINVAKSFIKQLNIDTTPSKTIIHFRNGLKYYWNTQYPEAKKEFSDILNLIPNNNYANEYLHMIAKSER